VWSVGARAPGRGVEGGGGARGGAVERGGAEVEGGRAGVERGSTRCTVRREPAHPPGGGQERGGQSAATQPIKAYFDSPCTLQRLGSARCPAATCVRAAGCSRTFWAAASRPCMPRACVPAPPAAGAPAQAQPPHLGDVRGLALEVRPSWPPIDRHLQGTAAATQPHGPLAAEPRLAAHQAGAPPCCPCTHFVPQQHHPPSSSQQRPPRRA
jgi:hypothetical protein